MPACRALLPPLAWMVSGSFFCCIVSPHSCRFGNSSRPSEYVLNKTLPQIALRKRLWKLITAATPEPGSNGLLWSKLPLA
jgi:hypothetical protein